MPAPREAMDESDGNDVADDAIVAPQAEDRPSKTRLKQRMHALQALGERLVTLSETRLASLPLDESLRDAIVVARAVRSHEGRRRQMQFVGRLMRSADAAAIEAALAGEDAGRQRQVAVHHAAERWRDGLIDGSLHLEAWFRQFPPAADDERQGESAALTRLVAAARRAAEGDSADPRHSRALYRALHRWLSDR